MKSIFSTLLCFGLVFGLFASVFAADQVHANAPSSWEKVSLSVTPPLAVQTTGVHFAAFNLKSENAVETFINTAPPFALTVKTKLTAQTRKTYGYRLSYLPTIPRRFPTARSIYQHPPNITRQR